jgi:NAD(P)-dependent dehydrogenase (short-subunit alcohol dehydrogenase family)
MTEFEGMVAIVTGAVSGIGAATGALLAERGATVAGLDIDADHVKPPAAGIVCDVSDRGSVAAAVEEVVGRFGRIDVLVNNAVRPSGLSRMDYGRRSAHRHACADRVASAAPPLRTVGAVRVAAHRGADRTRRRRHVVCVG